MEVKGGAVGVSGVEVKGGAEFEKLASTGKMAAKRSSHLLKSCVKVNFDFLPNAGYISFSVTLRLGQTPKMRTKPKQRC